MAATDHTKGILEKLERGKGKIVVLYFADSFSSKRYNPPWKRDGAAKLVSKDKTERAKGLEILARAAVGENWEIIGKYNRIVGELKDYKKEMKYDQKKIQTDIL